MSERSEMLREVQSLDFAVHEAALYLDINNRDTKALKYFNHYQMLASDARKMFEKKYGPLQYCAQENIERWKWTESPWPWQCDDGRIG